jgi:hypothetical protein
VISVYRLSGDNAAPLRIRSMQSVHHHESTEQVVDCGSAAAAIGYKVMHYTDGSHNLRCVGDKAVADGSGYYQDREAMS